MLRSLISIRCWSTIAAALAILSCIELQKPAIAQTSFYYKGTGSINSVTNWSSTINLTGSSPTNFTTANQNFNILSGQSATLGGAWTVSGTNSRVIVQGGGSFATGSNNPTLTLDLQSGATYSMNNSTYTSVTFGSIASNSTFNVSLAGSSTGFRDSLTYGNLNLTYNTSGNSSPGSITTTGNFTGSTTTSELRVATGSTARTWTIGGNLTNVVGTTLNMNNSGSAAATVNLSGNLVNNGTITKTAAGAASLNFVGNGTSTATWGTITTPASLLNVTIASGRTVTFLDNLTTSTTLSLTNSGTLNFGNGGTIGGVSGNFINNGTVSFNRSSDSSFSDVMSGTGGVVKVNSNVYTLSGANTYSGGTIINGGTVLLSGSGTTGSGSVSVNTTGTLDMGGTTRTVGAVSLGGGTIQNGTLTGTSYSSTGGIISANLAGAGSFTNVSGTTTLSGLNTFSGGTIVNGGTLNIDTNPFSTQLNVALGGTLTSTTALLALGNSTINGATSGAGILTLDTAATLSGSGTIGNALVLNGALAPGNSVGTLTATNGATWNGGTSWNFELGAGGTSDLLNITGDFMKGTGTLFGFNFGGSTQTGTFKLVDWTGGTNFAASDFSYTNLGAGNSGVFALNGSQLEFSISAVPEPTSMVLVGLGITGLVVRYRRNRKTKSV